MRLNKKAFTLIELLAVIAILAIVMIIAVPTVLNTIATAKKGAFKDSVLGIIKQAESNFNENLVLDSNYKMPLNNEYIVIDVTDLKFDNKNKYEGYILLVNNNGTYEYYPYVSDNEYCIDGILKGNISTSNIKEAKNCTNNLIATDISIDTNKKVTTTVSGTTYKYAGVIALTANLTISTIKDFAYTGSEQTYTVPEDGYYKIELWGAAGGGNTPNSNTGSRGGAGGYTSGTTYLSKNTNLKIFVGGKGTISPVNSFGGGGYNGGGNARAAGAQGSGGGGATDIRLNNTLNSRIMVAGAGGGTDDFINISASGVLYGSNDGTGGYGGGLVAGNGYNNGVLITGTAITETTSNTVMGGGTGYGGSQTGGYRFGIGEFASYSNDVAGAGGGYYGGLVTNTQSTGAGGGSSFISGYPGCNAITSESSLTPTNQPIHYSKMYFKSGVLLTGIDLMPNPQGGEMLGNIGDGFARITQLK